MKLRFSTIIAAAFFTVTAFSSCTREYICQCTIKYTGEPGLPDSTVREYEIRDTKKKAKSACEANSSTSTTGNIKTEETCKIF
ncbi:MAG TPA: hypothetical protein PL009_01640 [Flavipsychrobacter sp.]|nr:hypothetical protein [Flavipsychrobacter sp.]